MAQAQLIGRLAYSKAGRDRGKPVIIIKVINERLVMVVDGRTRSIENPKLKNIKHLQVTKKVAEELVRKIVRGDPLDDIDISRAVQVLVKEKERQEGGLGI
ncbi:MAG: RNA-binding protein [Syntrophomonadaceae bacterium]|jgi:large subunit ribosomal protein L14e|nr:RNA-binding protein [Syntrophomonadaceae bacterium]